MKRSMKFTWTLFLLALITPLLAQTGLKQNIQKKLEEATQQHRDETERQMDNPNSNPNPQQPTNPATSKPATPASTQPSIKSGWLFKAAKSDPTLKVRMFFAHPAASGENKLPGLLLVHEWWGLNEDIQVRTKEFAEKGFYAVAVDLYDRQVTADPKKAAELKSKLTPEAALLRLQTGLDLLDEEAQNKWIDPTRVGVIGWCMGGEQALLLSITDPRIKATAIYYGPLVKDAEKLKKLQGPVLGVFGNEDKRPSPEDVSDFQAALKTAGIKDVTIYTYDGVGHAFASKSAVKSGAYNEEKAKDAITKTHAWLKEKLLTPPAK